MEDQHYSDLLIELECPICTNYMSPPIRQCVTGHSICQLCRKKLPKCALCQGKFTESRNISLESLAVKMRYPCINKQSGCNVKLMYNEREVHEMKCLFKGFKCPLEKCCWIGNLNDIAQHWASKKMISKPYHENNVCHTKIKSESYYVNIIDAHYRLFWFKCKMNNKKLYWSVQLIGLSSEAQNYFYEIEIFKSDRVKRKILLSDYCQSVDIENSCLFRDGVCITVDTDMINPFLTGDQLLIYNMRVLPIQKHEVISPQASAERIQRDRSKGPFNQNRHKNNFKKGTNIGKQTAHGFVLL